jgi:hypothetical protein
MNKNQFNSIRKIAKGYINSESSICRICIDGVYILRYHEMFNKKYKLLFNNIFFFFFLFSLKIIQYFLIAFLKSLYSTIFTKTNSSYPKKLENIFISHYFNEKLISEKQDFYFNEIPFLIGGNVFYINHSKNKQSEKINLNGNLSLIPKILNLKDECIIIRLILKEMVLIYKEISPKNIFEFKFKYFILLNTINPSTFFNLRMYFFFNRIIANSKVEKIFLTFEGHSWEKAICFAAKKNHLKPLTFAYQHAPIFKSQDSIFQKENKYTLPDFILCSGSISKNIFVKQQLINSSEIFIFGSKRRGKISVKKKINNNILVLSDGTFKETMLLIDFSIAISKFVVNSKIYFRPHPAFNLNKIRSVRFPDNVILSKGTFNEDLQRTNFAIYRGSSSIVEAVNNSIVPIYLSIENEISIDPLWKINKNIINFKNPSQIINFLSKDEFTNGNFHYNDIFTEWDLTQNVNTLKNL